jgi:hypothetical protein
MVLKALELPWILMDLGLTFSGGNFVGKIQPYSIDDRYRGAAAGGKGHTACWEWCKIQDIEPALTTGVTSRALMLEDQ